MMFQNLKCPLNKFLALLALLLLTLSACKQNAAPDANANAPADALSVLEAWSRPAMSEGNGAVYFNIVNNTNQADTLLSAASDVSEVVEIHETIMENDVMRMQPIVNGVPVDAGSSVAFEPGGKHIMLIGLHAPLEEGQRINLRLTFAEQGEVAVEAEVKMQSDMN